MASAPPSLLSIIPLSVCSDSYKAGHFSMYPAAKKMVGYGEFRRSFEKSPDTRFVFYGIRYIVENYLNRKWTKEDVEKAELFYKTHNAGRTPYPWPKDLFLKFINENDGYFPIKLEALPEGTCAHIHVPVYQITAEGEYSTLLTWFETTLTQIWYPCSVATKSRRTKDLIIKAFEKSVDESAFFLIPYKLHDFGFRGVTGIEQAILGGTSHLLNFAGTDTMAAAYYAQFVLNNNNVVGESIPATEHSVMTSWRTEKEAIERMISEYGDGLFACVLDSYDYNNCLFNILPTIAEAKAKKKGHMVMRPDSGDPTEAIMLALQAGEKAFGVDVNKKGFKVLRNASAIQGDGIDYEQVNKILEAAMAAGYSAQNVTFGMGGGLLQKVNRDTMSFATKLSYIEYASGDKRDVMKYPKTDNEKSSFPGALKVIRDEKGIPTVYPAESSVQGENLLKVVYDRRPVPGAFPETFDQLKARVEEQWPKLPATHDPTSAELKAKTQAWIEAMKGKVETMKKTSS